MEPFLSEEEKEALRIQHRSERDGKIRDRIKVVILTDAGWTFKKIAEALLLDEETVSRHLNEYITEKKLKLASGGSVSKLSAIQAKELGEHLEEYTYTKVYEICDYVEKKYGIKYTVTGMTSWLDQQGFSYKKPKGTPKKADKEKQKEFIKKYEEMKKTIPADEQILFADAVHPTMATKISYGWIRKGTDKLIPTTASRTRMNIIGSINLKTMDVTVSYHDTIDNISVEIHFKQLREKYHDARYIHLISDQGPYNISKATKEAAKKYNIILHYLPTYSPNLNPIERLWKLMNECARNNIFFSSPTEFKNAILNFFAKTWQEIRLSMTSRINDNFQIL